MKTGEAMAFMFPPKGAINLVYNGQKAIEGEMIQVSDIDVEALKLEGWKEGSKLAPPPVKLDESENTPTIDIDDSEV